MIRARWPVLLLIAFVLVGAAYGNSITNPFHFDDAHSVRENVYVRSFEHVGRYFTDVTVFSPLRENRAYRPILLLTYAVSHAIGGGHLWGYHLITLLLHVLGSLLVGLITRQMVGAGGVSERTRDLCAIGATALFAVHPLLSEAVNYVSARSTLQASVLMLASIWLYIRGRETGRGGLLAASSLVLLLALGTKIIAMTTPALLVFWELAAGPSRRSLRADGVKAWAVRLGPPVLIAIAFTALHEQLVADVKGNRSNIEPWSYFLTQTQVWVRYLAQFVWPEDLCADYVMRWSQAIWEGPTARAILINLGLVGGAFALGRRLAAIPFGVLWYYVSLSPTSSFMPLSEPATEHRVYVALPGVIFALAGLCALVLERWQPSRRAARIAAACAALILIALGARTVVRNLVWSSEYALWKDVVARSPDNGRAHLNYGLALMARNDLAGAKVELDKCAEVWPQYAFCYINLAVLALKESRLQDAEREIATAERLQPGNVYVNLWRGEVEYAAKRWPLAEAAYRRTLEIAPGYELAERGLAVALFEQGKLAEAKPLLEKLAAKNELLADGWYALGYIAQTSPDSRNAQGYYEAALRFDPAHKRARYNLAVIHHQAGRLADAIEHYEVLARDREPSVETLYNLALALWNQGEVDRARGARERLRSMSPEYPGLQSLAF